jgi:hypothetical protein
MVVMKKDPESERRRFIEKGGSVVSDVKETSSWTNICLRIPRKMVSDIDDIVIGRVGFTRTTWILQALQEKLISKDD